MAKKTYSRSLTYAIKDGIYFAIMGGAGESYISAFAIFLKLSNPQIGLLASIPQLLGAFMQLLSVSLLNRLKNRMPLITYGVIAQALSWIPLLILPLIFKPYASVLLIISVTAYYIFGNLSTPPWNSLMGDIVPESTRGAYFGYRNRIMSIYSLGAIVVGGLLLHGTEKAGRPWIGFSVLFLAAVIARLLSAYSLSKMENPYYHVDVKDDFSLIEFFAGFRHSTFVRFVIYTGLMHFSVMLAGPFFAVYMLRDLRFSYVQFMIAAAVAVLMQYFTLHNWGKFGDRFGNRKVLEITGFSLPIVPVLWLFTDNFYLILVIQMLAGLTWAGFNLSMANFIYDAIPSPRLAKCVAIFNIVNACGIFLGGFIGGWLSGYLPGSFTILDIRINFISNLQWLFLFSGISRLIISLIFVPTIMEIRVVESLTYKELIMRVSSIRPLSGLKFDLFTGRDKKNDRGNDE